MAVGAFERAHEGAFLGPALPMLVFFFGALRRGLIVSNPRVFKNACTGILENPGVGHNQPSTEGAEKENQHWERWAKKRTFVRAREGTYSHRDKQVIDQPRVFSSKD